MTLIVTKLHIKSDEREDTHFTFPPKHRSFHHFEIWVLLFHIPTP